MNSRCSFRQLGVACARAELTELVARERDVASAAAAAALFALIPRFRPDALRSRDVFIWPSIASSPPLSRARPPGGFQRECAPFNGASLLFRASTYGESTRARSLREIYSRTAPKARPGPSVLLGARDAPGARKAGLVTATGRR